MAITQATSSVLAANAALNNLNAGASIAFTKSVSVSGNLAVDTNTFVVDSVNDIVGIGKAPVLATVDIFRNVVTSIINLGDTGTRAGLAIRSTNANDSHIRFGSYASNAGGLQVANAPANVAYNFLINPYGGNVGIGTVTPNERLTVSGNLSASGDAFSNGAKLAAETFAIAMAIAVG